METRTESVRALPVEDSFSFRTKYRKALAIQQHPNRGVSATYLCGRCIQRRRRRGSDDGDGNLYDNACLERSKRRIRDFPYPMLAQRPGIVRALDFRISQKFQVGLAVINVTFHTAPVPLEATNSGQVAQEIDPRMAGGVSFNGRATHRALIPCTAIKLLRPRGHSADVTDRATDQVILDSILCAGDI
ncbi:hypothetical protein NUW54_g8011 [Trametes sanguinea]|uniref:Uncharacterized protein n=1 Tax=Trametes sanguinea TaxID=158606 RepID=A0ACC1PJL0_9APHY|nr:hypothetical protein NUW54_g8011 [Trametes sanguinea]